MTPEVRPHQYDDRAGSHQGTVAQGFQTAIKDRPARLYVMRPTVAALVGDAARGKNVVDYACGDGYWSRFFLDELGARATVGFDASAQMIHQAKLIAEGDTRQTYHMADLSKPLLAAAPTAEVAFAGFYLHYAQSYPQLVQMCVNVAQALMPGGIFFGLNNNPFQPLHPFDARFERSVEVAPDQKVPNQHIIPDGTKLKVTMLRNGTEVSFYIFRWSSSTIEKALKEAGFKGLRWSNLEVAKVLPEGIDRSTWLDFAKAGEPTPFSCYKD